MRYNDKKSFHVAVLWTVIALLIGIYLWFNYRRRKSSQRPIATTSVRSPHIGSPRNKTLSPKSVLIGLNELFVSSDPSMTICGTVAILRDLSNKVEDMYFIYTVPAELAGADQVPPENVRGLIGTFLESADLKKFKPHRIIFTNTREGRVSVARQLQAELTIDSDSEIVEQLQGKVPNVVLVASHGELVAIVRKFFLA